MIVLDSSVLLDMWYKKPDVLSALEQLRSRHTSVPCIALMSCFEVFDGAQHKSLKHQDEIMQFLEGFPQLETSRTTAYILARLKHKYESQGKSLPLADLLIASQAIEHGVTLVTRDRDFERIEELQKIII